MAKRKNFDTLFSLNRKLAKFSFRKNIKAFCYIIFSDSATGNLQNHLIMKILT